MLVTTCNNFVHCKQLQYLYIKDYSRTAMHIYTLLEYLLLIYLLLAGPSSLPSHTVCIMNLCIIKNKICTNNT